MGSKLIVQKQKTNMKILFITPLPPPVHGSAMVSQYIKDSTLVNGQFDCDFVNLSTSRRMDEIGKGGAKKILRFIGSYFALFFKLLTRRYDLCYLAITCHGMGFLKDAPFVLLCRLFRRKIVIHQHNKGMSRDVERWPYRWLLPLVYRNTRVILLSWYLYPDIEKVVKKEQVVICPNGIPDLSCEPRTLSDESVTSDLQSEVEEERGFVNPQLNGIGLQIRCDKGCNKDREFSGEGLVGHPEENSTHYTLHTTQANERVPRLLFLSNLIESKGIYVLLDACKVLRERSLDFRCDYVGGESKRVSGDTFRAAIAERGLSDCVTYHGPQYGNDKHRFFCEADIFVQPTYDDCFPLTLVEAMQYRLPIVSTDVGAIPDMVVNGENGYLCQQQDVASLADALENLITNPALRRQMGEKGYARYREEYTLEVFERRFCEAFGNG